MPESKPKIKLSELKDIYDIEDMKNIPDKETKKDETKSEFEIYTESYDEQEIKENG